MWRRSFKYAALPSLSSLSPLSHLLHPPTNPKPFFKPKTLLPLLPSINNTIRTHPFSSSSDSSDSDSDGLTNKLDSDLLRDADTIISSLRDFASDSVSAKRRLETCGVSPSPALVDAVLSRLRHDWGAAFTFFLWAGDPSARSLRGYHSMISILARHRRFDTAFTLAGEMRRRSLATPHTLLILIRRYSAAHDVGRAINTFYAFKNYGFAPELEHFQSLLSALCRYKNVEDAEHLLLCNERTFPFDTKSFNIVLNGWCNVLVYLKEAKRFWRDMGNRGIAKDVVSYGSMISCFSKAGNLNDVLKLFNRMKDAGIEPDVKVYNAVVYALAKGRCVDDARSLLKTMEEKGINPNAVTFNSLIRPLCKARRTDEAREMFEEMLNRGHSPSVRTYHAFFDASRTVDEVFDLLSRMKRTGCSPTSDTYIMLIRKLCRWRQHECVSRLWGEMDSDGLGHDRSAYIVLIHGLFLNGKLEEACKYYDEMKAKGLAPEPKTEEMIQAWISGKEASGRSEFSVAPLNKKPKHAPVASRPSRDSLKLNEIRTVTRERGFSLW